jgi:hypothetical protein
LVDLRDRFAKRGYPLIPVETVAVAALKDSSEAKSGECYILPGDHREVTTIKRLFYAGNMAELFAASVSHPSELAQRSNRSRPPAAGQDL